MLEDDKVAARKKEAVVSRLPPLPISSGPIHSIARKGQENPSGLTPTEVYHLCNAVVAANKP